MQDIKIRVENFNFYYDSVKALKDISMDIRKNKVTGIIGPSGCGKSTFLRGINRMNDIIVDSRAEGRILIDDKNIYDPADKARFAVPLRPAIYIK